MSIPEQIRQAAEAAAEKHLPNVDDHERGLFMLGVKWLFEHLTQASGDQPPTMSVALDETHLITQLYAHIHQMSARVAALRETLATYKTLQCVECGGELRPLSTVQEIEKLRSDLELSDKRGDIWQSECETLRAENAKHVWRIHELNIEVSKLGEDNLFVRADRDSWQAMAARLEERIRMSNTQLHTVECRNTIRKNDEALAEFDRLKAEGK
jgi:hypothetical protein